MQIAELKFGDVGRGLGRYRPVMLAVVAIIVMGLTLPGPRRVTGRGGFDLGAFDSPTSAGLSSSAVVPQAEATPEVAAAITAIESSPSSFSLAFSTSPASAAPASSFSVDASVSRAEAAEPASSSTFDSSTPSVSESRGSTSVTSTPLRVTTTAWASAQAGTPLAATGVPAGSLPVGRRPGFEIDKVAFVRLAGSAATLTLVPHEDATGQRGGEAAQIHACRITTPAWAEAEAQSVDEAPKWDCGVAVAGQRADDGSWTFDLSIFPDRTGSGFALVPAGAALDFQVAFKVT